MTGTPPPPEGSSGTSAPPGGQGQEAAGLLQMFLKQLTGAEPIGLTLQGFPLREDPSPPSA